MEDKHFPILCGFQQSLFPVPSHYSFFTLIYFPHTHMLISIQLKFLKISGALSSYSSPLLHMLPRELQPPWFPWILNSVFSTQEDWQALPGSPFFSLQPGILSRQQAEIMVGLTYFVFFQELFIAFCCLISKTYLFAFFPTYGD